MKWQNTEVSKLSNEDLKAGYITLAEMDNSLLDKKATERYKKLMLNQPDAPVNPMFLQLQNEMSNELKRRNLA